MTQIGELLQKIGESALRDKISLIEYLINALDRIRLEPGDEKALLTFADEQTADLLDKLQWKRPYKETDLLCAYGDRILAVYPLLLRRNRTIEDPSLSQAKRLFGLMKDKRPIDTLMQAIFSGETVESVYVDRLLSFARNTFDEYEKGRLYAGLLDYKDSLGRIKGDAGNKLTAHFEGELERYLNYPDPGAELLDSWELAVDAARYFPSEKIEKTLLNTLNIRRACIAYYAVETLLYIGVKIPGDCIPPLAADLTYAFLTYSLLERYGLCDLFPPEYASPEYLAKSDLVHWLTYPTELGKMPDQIEYVGKIKPLFGETYYVFKYRSQSKTLSNELRGRWLIGWSSRDGGTFSNFDLMDEYEKEDVDKTLKNIKKRLIGRSK